MPLSPDGIAMYQTHGLEAATGRGGCHGSLWRMPAASKPSSFLRLALEPQITLLRACRT